MTEPHTAAERAVATLTTDAAAELLAQLIAIPSPTGHERPIATAIADHLVQQGIPARVQAVAGDLVNVVVGARSDGRRRLLLYGQLDTALTGRPVHDTALTGEHGSAEYVAAPSRDGDWMFGLGAENPKSYLAADLLAVQALAAVGGPRTVQLVAGFCGGGMPALADATSAVTHAPLGYGRGCRALIDGIAPVCAAIVPKPGFAVSWEEVGVATYRVRVEGSFGYTGIRSFAADENTVAVAARFVLALEEWFARYAGRHETAFVRPRGAVVAVCGGDPARPAFWPQAVDLDVDLRLPPGVSADDIDREMRAEVARIAGEQRVAAVVDRRFVMPGARTAPEAPVVRAAVAAWQAMTGQLHEPRTGTSGWTDATTLRNAGIDTARIGPPRPPRRAGGPPFSMGAVHLPSVVVLAEWLIRTVLAFDEQYEGKCP